MTSKERILAAWQGRPTDHIPLTTWCFGLPAHPELAWTRDGVPRRFWYSLRMEHLHTWRQPWDLADDTRRVLAWRALGVDDVLDVSVPWSTAPGVSWKDTLVPAGTLDPNHPVLTREYQTPAGVLRHAVPRTGEEVGAGWVVQPDCVPLIEDFNIPRAVKHAVAGPEDVAPLGFLYAPPDAAAAATFEARAAEVSRFAAREGVAVQAWSAFGMDAAVWFCGTQGAVLLAMDYPDAFKRLMETIAATDYARTALAAQAPGIDLLVQRGWYSSTDLWSPRIFDTYVFPHTKALADLAHRHGKLFGYTMTTGVEHLGRRLLEAGVDVLYFVDPVQDGLPLERAKALFGGAMTLVGGLNTVALTTQSPAAIRTAVHAALDVLGPTGRFILHPVDALFPDTPWSGIEAMIAAWRERW